MLLSFQYQTLSTLFLVLIYSNYGKAEDLKDLNPMELLKLGEDVTQVELLHEISTEDVKFYVASADNTPQLVTLASTENVTIDLDRNTKILIHGWLENHRRSWYEKITAQYISKGNLNVIQVDWEPAARRPYPQSAKVTKIIGNQVAQFIQKIKLSPNSVHIIGHSLGAHVAGFAGKTLAQETGEKLFRISALDPAGPYFRQMLLNRRERLDKSDADIVDVIHTDSGFYGYEYPTGTLDIYVNRGRRTQPGCFEDFNESKSSIGAVLEASFCSHARSVEYFIEWISGGSFKCKFCRHVDCLLKGKERALGPDDINVTGVCYAKTAQEEPYLST